MDEYFPDYNDDDEWMQRELAAYAQPEEEEEPGLVSDFSNTAISAVNKGLAGMARTADTIFSDGIDGEFIQRLEDNATYAQDQLSDEQKIANQREFITEDDEGNYGLGDAWTSGRSIMGVGANAIGSIAPMAVTGGVVGTAVKKGLAMAGAKGLAQQVGGAAAFGASETAMVTGGVAGDIREGVNAMPDEVVATVPKFQDNFLAKLEEGMDEDTAFEQARMELGRELSIEGMKDVALPSFILGTLAGTFLDKFMTGTLKGSRLSRSGKGVLTEAPTEGLQGATEHYTTQEKLSQVDESIDPMRGVANAGVMEALGGVAMGGGLGAISRADSGALDEGIDRVDGFENVNQNEAIDKEFEARQEQNGFQKPEYKDTKYADIRRPTFSEPSYMKIPGQTVDRSGVRKSLKEDKDQRLKDALRMSIDKMSKDDQANAIYELREHSKKALKKLYTSSVSGIPNKQAYDDSIKKKYVAFIDVDNLKWRNDFMGHGAGDSILKEMGDALAKSGLDAYHLSGDEYVVQGDSKKEINLKLKKIQAQLAKSVAKGKDIKNGDDLEVTGVGFSFGISGDVASADAMMQADKREREKLGLRSSDREADPKSVKRTTQESKVNRETIYNMVSQDLEKGGGIVVDKDGRRSPSVNADWFKDGAFTVESVDGSKRVTPTYKEIVRASEYYKEGKKLTKKQQNIINGLNDEINAQEQRSNEVAESQKESANSILKAGIKELDAIDNNSIKTLDDLESWQKDVNEYKKDENARETEQRNKQLKNKQQDIAGAERNAETVDGQPSLATGATEIDSTSDIGRNVNNDGGINEQEKTSKAKKPETSKEVLNEQTSQTETAQKGQKEEAQAALILTQTKSRYVNNQLKKEGIKKSSPGYAEAKERIEEQRDSDLERAEVSLPFEEYVKLPDNQGKSESLLKSAYDVVRDDLGITDEVTNEPKKQNKQTQVKSDNKVSVKQQDRAENEAQEIVDIVNNEVGRDSKGNLIPTLPDNIKTIKQQKAERARERKIEVEQATARIPVAVRRGITDNINKKVTSNKGFQVDESLIIGTSKKDHAALRKFKRTATKRQLADLSLFEKVETDRLIKEDRLNEPKKPDKQVSSDSDKPTPVKSESESKGQTKDVKTDIKFSKSVESNVDLSKKVDNFKKWSNDNQLIESYDINDHNFSDGKGVVVKVFHGTTHEFNVFDAEKGNKQGQFGAVNYFTSSEYDAVQNYKGMGADLTQRIELRTEELEQAYENDPAFFDMDDDADFTKLARNKAVKELQGDTEKTMELYVKIDSPFVVGDGDTWIEFVNTDDINDQAIQTVADNKDVDIKDLNVDEFQDEIDEARYEIEVDAPNLLREAIDVVADRYNLNPSEIMADVYDTEYTTTALESLMRNDEQIGYAEDEGTGELVGYQVLSDIIQELGFDGIILKNAESRFTSMDMETGTAHVHVFHENKTNIKSVNDNIEYNPSNPNIYKSKSTKVQKTGSTVDQVKSWLPRRARKIVEVVQSVNELPESLRGIGNELLSKELSEVEGLYTKNKVYLIADMLNKDNINSVLAHELLHHRIANDPKLKAQLDSTQAGLRDVFDKIKDGTYKGRYKKLYDEAMERTKDAKTPIEDEFDEFMSYSVSTFNKTPQSIPSKLKQLLQKLVALVKGVLTKVGISTTKLTPGDLNNLAMQIVDNKVGKIDKSILASIKPAGDILSEQFKKWFGKSKIKSGGKPIKFYHGTNADFTVFDSGKVGKSKGEGIVTHSTAELGHFFTADKGTADSYGDTTHEVYLSIENPYVLTADILDQKMGDDTAKFVKSIKAKGHDGIYVKDAKYAIAFESNQVKLTSNKAPTSSSDVRFSKQPKFTKKVNNAFNKNKLSEGIGRENQEKYGILNNKLGAIGELATKYFTTLDNVARNNPVARPFLDMAKAMQMRKDELLSGTNDAVKAYNSIGKHGVMNAISGTFDIEKGKSLQQKRLDKALFDGTIEETIFSDKQLKERFNLSDKSIEAHKSIREYMDKMTNEYKDALLERIGIKREGEVLTLINPTGKKKDADLLAVGHNLLNDFNGLTSYFPLMRFGEHTVTIKNSDGDIVYFGAEESKSKQTQHANKIRAEFDKSHKVTVGFLAQNKRDDLAFDPRMLNMLGKYQSDIPGFSDIFDEVEQDILKNFSSSEFKKRFIHRKKTKGYSGDVARTLASYGWSSSNYISKLKFIPEMQTYIDDMDKHKNPKVHTHLQETLDYIKKPVNEYQAIKSFTFMYYMGANVKSAMVNLTQIPVTLGPYLANKFGDKATASAVVRAGKVALKENIDTPKTKVEEYLKWAQQEGLTFDAYLGELIGAATGKRAAQARLSNRVLETATLMFSKAEMYNRRVSVASAYLLIKGKSISDINTILEKEGHQIQKTKDDAIKEFIKLTVTKTQFDYGRFNKAAAFRGWGSVPLQFNQFMINYLQFIAGNGGGVGATVRSLGMVFLFAGLMGLPGADDLRAALEYAYTKLTGKHIDLQMESRKALVDVAETFMSDASARQLAEMALYGGFSLTPLDISGSVGAGRVIPGMGDFFDTAKDKGELAGLSRFIMGASGASAGIVRKTFRGVEEYEKSGEISRLAEKAVPFIAVQNVLKSIRMAMQGVDRNYSGKISIAYKPDILNTIAQALSFTPGERKRLYREKNVNYREANFLKMAHQKLLTRLSIAVAEKDKEGIRDARKIIAEWNKEVPVKWRLKASKVRRSIKARSRNFDTASTNRSRALRKQFEENKEYYVQ